MKLPEDEKSKQMIKTYKQFKLKRLCVRLRNVNTEYISLLRVLATHRDWSERIKEIRQNSDNNNDSAIVSDNESENTVEPVEDLLSSDAEESGSPDSRQNILRRPDEYDEDFQLDLEPFSPVRDGDDDADSEREDGEGDSANEADVELQLEDFGLRPASPSSEPDNVSSEPEDRQGADIVRGMLERSTPEPEEDRETPTNGTNSPDSDRHSPEPDRQSPVGQDEIESERESSLDRQEPENYESHTDRSETDSEPENVVPTVRHRRVRGFSRPTNPLGMSSIDIMTDIFYSTYQETRTRRVGSSHYEERCRKLSMGSDFGLQLPDYAIHKLQGWVADLGGDYDRIDGEFLGGAAVFTYEEERFVQLLQGKGGCAILDAVVGGHPCFSENSPVRSCIFDQPSLRVTFFCNTEYLDEGLYMMVGFRTTQARLIKGGNSILPLTVINHKKVECKNLPPLRAQVRDLLTRGGTYVELTGGRKGLTNTIDTELDIEKATSGRRERTYAATFDPCNRESIMELIDNYDTHSSPNLFLIDPRSHVGMEVAEEGLSNILLFCNQMTHRFAVRLLQHYRPDYDEMSALQQDRLFNLTFISSSYASRVSVFDQVFTIVKLADRKTIIRLQLDQTGVLI